MTYSRSIQQVSDPSRNRHSGLQNTVLFAMLEVSNLKPMTSGGLQIKSLGYIVFALLTIEYI